LGDSQDVLQRWSTADADNHSFVIALGDSNQALHVTDKGAVATDWNVAADTHPTVYVHSNTTPATDYLKIGAHDGTTAEIDVVGGTTLSLKIAGTENAEVNTSGIQLNDGKIIDFGTGNDARALWSTADADNHSLVIGLGDDNQSLHITDKGAQATDWNVTARTHPSVFIHSNTTPATDYLDIGNHDGSTAWINMVGGAGLDIAIDGVRVIRYDDGAITFAAAAATAGVDMFVKTANGGASAADTNGVAGGGYTLTAGSGAAGGAHTAANPTGGNGGSITLTPGTGGAAGSGGTGVAGDPGKVKLGAGCLHFTSAQVIDMADTQVVLTLNPGTPVGTTITSNMLFVDANSSGTEDLLLPPEADCNGLFLMVVNTGGEDIVVKEDSDTTTIATVSTAESAIFTCNGTLWAGGVVKAT
jgi:hypothetical protein